MEYFTADFMKYFTKKRQNFAFEWLVAYSPLNPSILGTFLKFPNLLISQVLRPSETHTFTLW